MKRALHVLRHEKKLTCNQGELVPIGVMEALPGDSFDHAISALMRTQPLLAPVMHSVETAIHTWFVPYRVIWDDWEKFITGGEDGEDSSVFPTITFANGGITTGSLADYLGLPPNPSNTTEVSALPFRAVALIWNNFYRDKDLQTELTIDTTSGADTTTSTALQYGCWEKDYFTSARPEPQRGPEVVIPLTGDAPVTGIGLNTSGTPTPSAVNMKETGGSGYTTPQGWYTGTQNFAMAEDPGNTGYPGIYADLSGVGSVGINQLRLSSAIQRFQERLMRFGFTYPEYLRAFGVKPQDSRMQWPEYLGGGKQVIQFSEVLQTAPAYDPDDEQVGEVGALKGHGIGAMRSNRYKFFAPEHGIIISFMITRPKTNYVQGLNKLWNRRSKFDFFDPAFQNLGQQEVLYKELYAAHTTPNGVFGYQDRWDEYRRIESTVAGEFRNSLDFWHMARIFGSDPALNADFVKSNPTNRIYATDADQLQIRAMHRIKAKRLVSKVARPMLY